MGYAPSAPDRVARAARSRGFTAAELNAAGLSGRGGDRFRERVIFPLADAGAASAASARARCRAAVRPST